VIERLSLRNFKAFLHVTMRLAPMTLLSGVNAAGKSTVMQALAALRQSHAGGTLSESGLLLNGDLVELGTGQDVLCEDSLDEPPSIGVTLREHGKDYEWAAGYNREDDFLPIVERPARAVASLSLFRQGFQYLRADRINPAVHYPKSYQHAVQQGFLGVQGEHTVNYLRVHQDEPLNLPRLLHPDTASGSLLDQVNAWMQELCPGVNLRVEELRGTDFVRLHFGFFGTAGIKATNRYRPTNVGFGLTYVLPVVVACLAARPGALIMVENPEAHLHPRGQTLMGRLACLTAAAGVQLLVETHSDHVLNGVRLAVKDGVLEPAAVEMHYFHRAKDGKVAVATPTIGPDGMLSDWPEGFFDEWDRALDQLLT